MTYNSLKYASHLLNSKHNKKMWGDNYIFMNELNILAYFTFNDIKICIWSFELFPQFKNVNINLADQYEISLVIKK